MAGYSQTPLKQKLGIKDNLSIKLINPPDEFLKLLQDLPAIQESSSYDYLHLFVKSKEEVESGLTTLTPLLKKDGMLWISWPKKSSHIQTNLSENIIREIGLARNLVDIKIVSINDTWSALKFVIPLKLR